MSITLIIIAITVVVSLLAFQRQDLFYRLDFSPFAVEQRKEWYRFLSHSLLHADWVHLLVNMFVLFIFGDITQAYFEAYAGAKGLFYFILLYVGGVAFAVLPTYRKHKNDPNYHSVGASGAVSSVLFSSVIFQPGTELCLYGLPFLCFPGIIWAIAYLAYSYYKGKQGGDYVNHDAHFWGAVYGVVFTFITVPRSILAFIDQILALLPF
jgi:membrane associated rhomboid family serine protease